jgi:hypothetical protein
VRKLPRWPSSVESGSKDNVSARKLELKKEKKKELPMDARTEQYTCSETKKLRYLRFIQLGLMPKSYLR